MYKVYAFRKGKAAHTKALALPIAQEVANRIRNEVTTAMIVNVEGKSNPPVVISTEVISTGAHTVVLNVPLPLITRWVLRTALYAVLAPATLM